MAWIKVTNFNAGGQYCINTDKLISFGRPDKAQYTNLWEPGDVENDREPRRVKETPDELLNLIREAEFVGYRGAELQPYAFPPEALK